ncbi:hypothetical protein Q4543_24585, partial [Salipiger sp. 1_MG-2023]|uniref:hypothetical protein n=1 Tax=Salipiger sp. 1_MG-2023 TaxID=3062665 RepID=UPI0026E21915
MSQSPFSPAAWAPYARALLRRLRKAEADDTFDPAIGADGDVIAPPKGGPSPSAIELLDEIARNRGEGACEETGANVPAPFIDPEKALLALRLAAS